MMAAHQGSSYQRSLEAALAHWEAPHCLGSPETLTYKLTAAISLVYSKYCIVEKACKI